MVSPARQVVIDDSNSQVHYVGSGWFQDLQGSQDNVGNFGPPYKETSHGTKGNDSIAFSFIGSSVTVWGTMSLKLVDNGTSFDPKWECFVDGISIGATKPFQLVENNLPLCQQGTITAGSHVITINVTTAGTTFWFDYLTFTPSSGAFYATLLVQNTDSDILYDAGWSDLDGRANVTTKIGSKMKFDFVGTSLTWVGFIPTGFPRNGSTASYSIDSGSSTRFELKGLPPTATNSLYNQVFFTTPDLPIGQHTIIVTYEGSNVPSTPLTLDYLFITHVPIPANIPANITSTGSTVASADATIGTSSASFTSSLSTTSSLPTPSSTSHLIGPVVGGVVGGLTVIALILFAVRWWQRHARRTNMNHKPGFLDTGNGSSNSRTRQTQITPYRTTPSMQHLQTVPLALSSPSGKGQPSSDVHSQSDASYVPSFSLPEYSRNNSSSEFNLSNTHTHTTSVETLDGSRYTAGARKNRRLISPVMHQDSGIRLNTSSQEVDMMVEDVPPMYTMA